LADLANPFFYDCSLAGCGEIKMISG